MKAADITKEGYYWYRHEENEAPEIVEISRYTVFNPSGPDRTQYEVDNIGDEVPHNISEYTGEFEGPIEYHTEGDGVTDGH